MSTYLDKSAKAVIKVYKAAVGCRHVLGTSVNTFDEMKKRKQLNCNRVASFTLQLAGCLAVGKLIGHRKKGKGKTTVDKAMYGRKLLKNCSVHFVNKRYKDLPKKYKVAGAVYIYDSNAAVSAGGGYICSCNGGGGYNKLKRRYTKFEGGIKRKNKGYSFRKKILVVILPKDVGETKKAKTAKKDKATKPTGKKGKKVIKTVEHKGKYKVVCKEGMRVRASYSTHSKILGLIGYGKTIVATKKHGNWIYAPGLKGWICVKSAENTYLKALK